MKILVIGEKCQDIYIYGRCRRICPEGPVPVFCPTHQTEALGMAGNVFNNLQSLGVDCDIISNVNKMTKTRYVDDDSNQLLLRIDENDSCERISTKNILFNEYDAIIVSDYCKGFMEEDDLHFISNKHNNCFLDSKKNIGSWAENFKFIKTNEEEYLLSKKYLDTISHKNIITLGSRGCKVNGKMYPCRNAQKTFDVAGAGDTFIAAFCFMYTKSMNIKKSINYAQKCCLSVIKKRGTAVP